MKIFLPITSMLFILLLILITGCGTKEKPEDLERLTTKTLNVHEPSGLAIAWDEKHFWTVSDEAEAVYRLDSMGTITESFGVSGSDPEGITVVDSAHIAVVLEENRKIQIYHILGDLVSEYDYPVKGRENSGFEGIAYNRAEKQWYIVNEKNPAALVVLDSSYNVLEKTEIKFARDLSGICYEPVEKKLWMLSDEDQKIIKCDLKGRKEKEYNINVFKPEGIAVSMNLKRVFIVSDYYSEIYIYSLKSEEN